MEDVKLIGLDLSTTSWEVIEVLIEDTSEPGVVDEVARANTGRPEILKLLIEHPNTPGEVRDFIMGVLQMPAVASKDVVAGEKEKPETEIKHQSLTTKIQMLGVSARVQLALKGGREIRGILARDPNKQVALSVLANGKITESEIELIAKNRSSLEESLRTICKNREWMKSYSVVFAVVNNPKTPPGIAVTHVGDLKTKDLVILEKNKNVCEAVRIATKKLLVARRPK